MVTSHLHYKITYNNTDNHTTPPSFSLANLAFPKVPHILMHLHLLSEHISPHLTSQDPLVQFHLGIYESLLQILNDHGHGLPMNLLC